MARPATTSARPLRIAMLTHSVNPRGGVVHALELGEALARHGHSVTVIAPAFKGQRFFRDVACEVELAMIAEGTGGARTGTGTGTGTTLVESVRRRIDAVAAHLRTLLLTGQFDVFHAQDSITANSLADLKQEGLLKRFFRTVHHLDRFDDPQLEAWQHRAHQDADKVFCVSRLWCDTMRIDYGVEAALVGNGVNLTRFGPATTPIDADVALRYGLRSGAPLILAVGGIEERKNTVRLLEAFNMLRRKHVHAQLVIAGGASLLDHDEYAALWRNALSSTGLRQGKGSDVVVTGPVDEAAMPSLYRLADVMAMPSLREGFGLAALEAIASGTPAVVSHMAPFTEFLNDDDVCWADPLDAASICRALERSLALRDIQGSNGAPLPHVASAALLERFNWPDSALRHAALYRIALDPDSTASPSTEITCPPCTTTSDGPTPRKASAIPLRW